MTEYPMESMGEIRGDFARDLDDTYCYVTRCPACGAAVDYCLGHGEIGDPAGYAILRRHDNGKHEACHPAGCEIAREASWDRFIPGTPEGD